MPAKAVYEDLDHLPRAAGAKFCKSCGTTQDATEFYRSRFQNDGLQSHCKTCQKARRHEWNCRNRGRYRERIRRFDVRQRFGISLEQYRDLMQGPCMVCGSAGDSLGRLGLDHDHATGEIRGVLCSNCNLTLGLVSDDPERLRALALYLERKRRVI